MTESPTGPINNKGDYRPRMRNSAALGRMKEARRQQGAEIIEDDPHHISVAEDVRAYSYEEFRPVLNAFVDKYGVPHEVCYPGCGMDATLLKVLPSESVITFIDPEDKAIEAIR